MLLTTVLVQAGGFDCYVVSRLYQDIPVLLWNGATESGLEAAHQM